MVWRRLLKPLKSMKVPVHEIALMMSISLRFIPTLMDETVKLLKRKRHVALTLLEDRLKIG